MDRRNWCRICTSSTYAIMMGHFDPSTTPISKLRKTRSEVRGKTSHAAILTLTKKVQPDMEHLFLCTAVG